MNNGDKMRTMTPFKLTNEELSAQALLRRFHGKCGYGFCPAYEGNGSYIF